MREARRRDQFDKVQHGLQPDDTEPMCMIAQGVEEIRIRDAPEVVAARTPSTTATDNHVNARFLFDAETPQCGRVAVFLGD